MFNSFQVHAVMNFSVSYSLTDIDIDSVFLLEELEYLERWIHCVLVVAHGSRTMCKNPCCSDVNPVI